MSDEKRPLALDPPIPTYEETIASRAPSDVGDHAETSQLLGERRSGTPGYRPPTVESERSSLESSFLEDFASSRGSGDGLEPEIEQMGILDPGEDEHGGERSRRPGRLRQNLSKRISSITMSLSSISLPDSWKVNPFKKCFPRFSIPEVPCFTAGLIPVYRFLGVVVILIVVYALLATDSFTINGPGNPANGLISFEPETVKQYVKDTLDKDKISHYLEYLTSFDHVAGTRGDLALGKWVEKEFRNFGLENVELLEYFAYLNYPKAGGRKVAIIHPPWEAVLEEPKTVEGKENTLAFHSHSKSGSATGPLIYANYGSREDFFELEKKGIDLKGAIVLVRSGGTQPDRSLKVKAAQDKGAAGCIIFSDPKTEGWDLPGDAVQRGGVGLSSWLVGDVLTPGYVAEENAVRIKKEDSPGLLKIPSLPLSWNDAQHLLKSLKGHGKKVDGSWEAGNNFNEEIWTGAMDSSPKVRLDNIQNELEKQPVFNVLGLIKGYDDYKKRITVGNHRDAWCFGASDPNSGTAIMLEVARIFGQMVEVGWKPSRSIIFASWDAKEYNLIGSTEYVEDNIEHLRLHGMAYINLDTAISGAKFSAAGSPLLETALLNSLGMVDDPQTGEPLQKLWGNKVLPGLGSEGDWVAWQSYAGVSSIDLGFTGGGFPHQSCFDTYEWMKTRGDPDFNYHKAMAQVLAMLILELADTPQLPFNMTNYAVALDRYMQDLEGFIENKAKASPSQDSHVDLGKLKEAIITAHTRLYEFDTKHEPWMDQMGTVMGGLDNYGTIHRNSRNARMSNFEEHLLDLDDGGGLPGRQWFKHVVFSPEAWGGAEPGYFPGVRDAVDKGDWRLAQEQVEVIAKRIDRASWKLLN